jgi:Na+/H+-dicarboxylate symporter
MSLTTRVLAGLVAGFALGLALAGQTSPAALATIAWSGAAGTLFINLIRMTVIPLVASLLIASIGSIAATRAVGRVAARALALAVILVTIAAVASVFVAQPIFARVVVDQTAAQALAQPAAGPQPAAPARGPLPPTPRAAQWFIDLVPANVVKAAADDLMLPTIVFAVLFGIALSRVVDQRRAAVVAVVQGIADTMQRLVGMILVLAPFGVFALAVPLAWRLGLGAAGAVVAYTVLVVALTVAAAVLLLYPVAVILGSMRPLEFAAFAAPAQAVAFASRSSLASLPAMLQSADAARFPPVISSVILPMAASTFRFGAAVAQTVGVLFIARLYGVELSIAQLATLIVTVVVTTFAVPGIPGGSVLAMVPVLTAVNLPAEGIGILLAVDAIPDMFRTTANVTGSLALAASLRKLSLTSTKDLVDNPEHDADRAKAYR